MENTTFSGDMSVLIQLPLLLKMFIKCVANGPIDCDKIKGKIFIRNRRNGDKIEALRQRILLHPSKSF